MGTADLPALSSGQEVPAALGDTPAELSCLFQASPRGEGPQLLFLLVLEGVGEAEFTLWFGFERAEQWDPCPTVEGSWPC